MSHPSPGIRGGGAELGRDVLDPYTGYRVHETVSADGVGMRFGVAWGF